MTSDNGTTKSQTKSQPTAKAASTGGETAAKPEASTPANYSRGEKQKPVTNSYKENWDRIYGKKKKRSK